MFQSIVLPSSPEKLAWLSSLYLPPTAPAPLLTNPYNYVGHKGSDLAAGPKRGWAGRGRGGGGRGGGGGLGGRAGPGWKFLLFLCEHRFQTNQNNCHHHPSRPPSSPQQPTWPVTSHHFYAGNAARSGAAVRWRGGEAARAPASHCWKRADGLNGISFDRQKYWRIWFEELRVRFVMTLCTSARNAAVTELPNEL